MDLVRLLGMEATYSHRKLGAILGATTMYVAAVLMLRPAAGDSILIAVIVPVLITAWSFGARAALLASLLAIMLNVFFVTVVGDEGIAAWLLMGGALARGAALTGAAVLVGRLRDLRAQHERELSEREAVQSALRENEECYRALFESAPLGIAITEAHGIIVQTNPALEEMLGRTADELRGSRLRDFRLDSPPPSENISRRLASTETGTLRYERQFVHSSGETVWAYVTATAVPSRTGQVEHVFRMIEDITERKEAERVLREAEAEHLDRTRHLASIGQLAAGVAHEINNPLNSVMGFTQLVLGEESLSAQARSDLETVYAESQRASKIVQNLLSFARKREPERRPVDVRAVVERACHLKEYDLRKHAIELRTHFSKSLPLILGDEQQLTVVMLNLLTNAEQAIASAGRPGAITVTCGASDGLVEITLANDGPGIPPEVLGRIFEPFFTTKEVGGGTGLGLSMCQGTVREHDGDLWAESTLDGDTTFF
ncbi:MAG: PAS domain S-box protein, partial [Chloroflexi bacterium]|nr:PAS domain S-box protein [Chloroflexota bacterium]